MYSDQTVEVSPAGLPPQAYYTGLWLAMAAIAMLFTGLTSALVVRKGISNDWTPVALPPALYYNLIPLVAGSAWISLLRRLSRDRPQFNRCRTQLVPVAVLGAVFLAGGGFAWRELLHRGVMLGTTPSGSFLYLMTATYGFLLLAGLAGVVGIVVRAKHLTSARTGAPFVNLAAIYWYFMTGLWIYLLTLMAMTM